MPPGLTVVSFLPLLKLACHSGAHLQRLSFGPGSFRLLLSHYQHLRLHDRNFLTILNTHPTLRSTAAIMDRSLDEILAAQNPVCSSHLLTKGA